MFGVTPLIPAYGRDYKNKVDVEVDFNLNKDFKTASGSYTSKLELKKMGLTSVEIRYDKLKKCTVVTL